MERERQARWDAANLHTASTKLTEKEYRRLQEACAVAGTSVYALIQRLLKAWLSEQAW